VMGGARSEVQEDTTRVLLEAATWDGANIHRTSLKLGLRSEASGRFEKGLAPELAVQAQAVATQLMIELTGASVAPGTIDVGGDGPPPATIRLRDARIKSLLGAEIPRPRCRQILEALEFETVDAPDGLDVSVPFFRRIDVTREADLIEEVARIDGVQKLPATLPPRRGASGRLTARQRMRRAVSDAFVAQGLHEVVGWSFAGEDLARRLRLADRAAVELENPMSAEQSRLRTTLLGSLLDVARRNRARGAGAVRVFEAGSVYLPRGLREAPDEPYHVGALLLGPVRPASWREPDPRAADFFAAKGALAGVLDPLRVAWTVQSASEPFLHPGRAARILIDGQPAGWLGELHPSLAADWDIEDTVAGFECNLDAVPEPLTPLFVDVTSFPEIREDLAVVVPDTATAAQVLELVRRAGAPLLADAEVFDVYRNPERLGEGKVSLAMRLSFRASDRTLTDTEVASQRKRITAALADEVGGQIRS
jgi:phenylalanyl-tRNA synthetase beta chain